MQFMIVKPSIWKWSYPKQQKITNNMKNPQKYKTIQRIQCEWEWEKIVNLRVYELQMAFFWEHKTLNIHLYVYVFRFSSLETRIPFIYAQRIGYPNTDNILAIANVKQLFGMRMCMDAYICIWKPMGVWCMWMCVAWFSTPLHCSVPICSAQLCTVPLHSYS